MIWMETLVTVCIPRTASPASLYCCIGCVYLRIRRRGASRRRGGDCADSPGKPAPPRLDTANRWPGSPGFLRPCCSPCSLPRPGSSYLCWSDGPVACLLLPHSPASSSPAAVTLHITHGFRRVRCGNNFSRPAPKASLNSTHRARIALAQTCPAQQQLTTSTSLAGGVAVFTHGCRRGCFTWF